GILIRPQRRQGVDSGLGSLQLYLLGVSGRLQRGDRKQRRATPNHGGDRKRIISLDRLDYRKYVVPEEIEAWQGAVQKAGPKVIRLVERLEELKKARASGRHMVLQRQGLVAHSRGCPERVAGDLLHAFGDEAFSRALVFGTAGK